MKARKTKKQDKMYHKKYLKKMKRLEELADNESTWNADTNIAKFVYRILKNYKKHANNFIVIDEEEMRKLNHVIDFFEMYANEDREWEFSYSMNREEYQEKVNEVFKDFGDIFRGLWW